MLPNCIVIGAMKAGSSALHDYMNMHPQISMSDPKETTYFVEELNWSKGIEWYTSLWPEPFAIRGETSHQYTAYPYYKGVPSRIHETVPSAKLIYIVRDPIQRLISHYVHNWKKHAERRPFEACLNELNVETNHYTQLSSYFYQLTQYLELFDAQQITLVCNEYLKKDPATTMRRVFQFLGVDDTFFDERFMEPMNTTVTRTRKSLIGHYGDYFRRNTVLQHIPIPNVVKIVYKISTRSRITQKPTLRYEDEQRLREFFAEDVRKLRGWSEQTFEDWSL